MSGAEVQVSRLGDKVILEPLKPQDELFDWSGFWAEIDALGDDTLFRDGPPEDAPTKPDSRFADG